MFQTEKEFKRAVSSLRKALREHYGKNIPNHTQSLELLATVLGATSYAQLRTRWTNAAACADAPKVESATATPPTADNVFYERLRNDKGQFDLVDSGEEGGVVVVGRDFTEVNGTVDDILYCVALAQKGYRADGELVPDYEGETQVNWDGQETRRNAEGDILWESDSYSTVPSSELILVPEDFDPEADPDERGKWPWRIRENLLDAYIDYAKQHDLVNKLIAGQSEFWDLEDDTLVEVADALDFALHYGELERLVERLKDI